MADLACAHRSAAALSRIQDSAAPSFCFQLRAAALHVMLNEHADKSRCTEEGRTKRGEKGGRMTRGPERQREGDRGATRGERPSEERRQVERRSRALESSAQ